MLGPPGRERPSKKEEEDTFLLSLFGHHLHPRQQRTAGGRKSWVTVQKPGRGQRSQVHKYKRDRDTLACLPVLTKHAPPHSGTHSLADDLAQPPDSLQHTRSPSTAHSEQDSRAGWFAAYQLQALPALSLLQGWVFPAGTSLRSLYSNLWKSVSDAAAPAYYLFISSLPAETLLSEESCSPETEESRSCRESWEQREGETETPDTLVCLS